MCVHRGSVLSSLLFILFLSFVLEGKLDLLLETIIFADDIVLIDEDVIKLQAVFNELQRFFEGNGFRISRSKIEYIVCPFEDLDAPPPDLILDSEILPKCKSIMVRLSTQLETARKMLITEVVSDG